MAEYQMTGHGDVSSSGRGVATMANWAGAALSLALLVGVGIWGYKLIVRDVSGVPVVRAAEGPMRVAPDNPGGSAAAHQGLAVNQVAGNGTAAPPPDQLTLAPRAIDLAEEDRPRPEMARAIAAKTPAAPARETVTQARLSAEDRRPDLGSDAAIQELANQIAAGVAPLSGASLPSETAAPEEEGVETAALEDDAEAEAEDVAAVEAEVEAPRFPGTLSRSLRPRLRPGGLRLAALSPAPESTAPEEIDPAEIPAGTPVVQLGAFESAEIARTEWDRLTGRFGDFLDGKALVVQKASSGGRIFYRLRAHGFADINDARRLCAALLAGRAECIPVTTR